MGALISLEELTSYVRQLYIDMGALISLEELTSYVRQLYIDMGALISLEELTSYTSIIYRHGCIDLTRRAHFIHVNYI